MIIEKLDNNNNNLKRLEDVLYLIDNLFVEPLSQRVVIKDYAKKILDNGVAYILKQNDSDIGLIAGYINQGKESFITAIGVDSHYQGFGGGKLLLNKFIDTAQKFKSTHIYLKVNVNAKSAVNMYRKAGFIETDKLDNDNLILTKYLNCSSL